MCVLCMKLLWIIGQLFIIEQYGLAQSYIRLERLGKKQTMQKRHWELTQEPSSALANPESLQMLCFVSFSAESHNSESVGDLSSTSVGDWYSESVGDLDPYQLNLHLLPCFLDLLCPRTLCSLRLLLVFLCLQLFLILL